METDPGEAFTASYDGKDVNAGAEFRITFQEETRIVGYPKVKLFVEGRGCHDMDLFVEIGKENKEGKLVSWDCTPHNRYQNPLMGFEGRLRASLRALNLELSSEAIPVHSFEKPEYLNDGEIVEVEISLRPLGLKWEAGETLVLRIGNEYRESIRKNIHLGKANDMGMHIIYCGGDKASYVELPVIQKDSK